mmetsp:Transcript_30139/g.89689  ORF Transcript_30139/g.89689 Transcript_30139/m.89689 type:complete len:110 (-) Transcript_30139:1103-1432(-)
MPVLINKRAVDSIGGSKLTRCYQDETICHAMLLEESNPHISMVKMRHGNTHAVSQYISQIVVQTKQLSKGAIKVDMLKCQTLWCCRFAFIVLPHKLQYFPLTAIMVKKF